MFLKQHVAKFECVYCEQLETILQRWGSDNASGAADLSIGSPSLIDLPEMFQVGYFTIGICTALCSQPIFWRSIHFLSTAIGDALAMMPHTLQRLCSQLQRAKTFRTPIIYSHQRNANSAHTLRGSGCSLDQSSNICSLFKRMYFHIFPYSTLSLPSWCNLQSASKVLYCNHSNPNTTARGP